MIDIKELYWVAGLFEGEGHIAAYRRGVYNNRCIISIQIQLTDRDVLEEVRRILGIGYIGNGRIPNGSKKVAYMYSITDKKQAVGLLMTMYPLLKSRRQAKIREALALWQECPVGKQGFKAY